MNPIARMMLNIITQARAAKKSAQPVVASQPTDAKGVPSVGIDGNQSPPFVPIVPKEVKPVENPKGTFEPIYQTPPIVDRGQVPFNMMPIQNGIDQMGGNDIIKMLQLMKRR